MGILDFFKKGTEKQIEKKQNTNTSSPLRNYTIKSGDSLSKIAKHFYGDAKAWDKIYKANQHIIKNPDLIHPGQQIIIP